MTKFQLAAMILAVVGREPELPPDGRRVSIHLLSAVHHRSAMS